MKICVVGGWKPEKIDKYRPQAESLGYELAKRDHTLVSAPSSGIQAVVAEAYKNNGGKEFIGYYPALYQMRENVMVEPDVPVYTQEDYPVRNLFMVRQSDALFAITGGSRTVSELNAAMRDYRLPTAFYAGSNHKVDGYRKLGEKFAENLIYGNDIVELLDKIESFHNL